ncbi:MAG: C4-dicarboxylate ABC transporter [Acidobacteria bacterium]|nr:C4-dicarboxylate ABC transporter [Acidobacteriota bacterium]
MNIPAISLAALFIAILLSCVSRLNVGFLSFAFAFVIGVLAAGMKVSEVAAGFPTSLFLTLVAVTLLFSQARVNGTLDKLAKLSMKLSRGNPGLIPIVFFGLGLLLAMIGPGNIAATALLAPIAMDVAGKAGIPGFLMAIMLVNGANAGGLSPFSPTGVIAIGLLKKIGLSAVEWQSFFNTLISHSIVAFLGYFAFGGIKLFGRQAAEAAGELCRERVEPFDSKQRLTLGVIGALVASVVCFRVDVVIGAFVGAVALSLLRAADEEEAIKAIPWSIVLMVSGVTVLIALMEKTGGMDLFTSILARFATQTTVTGMIAFLTGVISVYSSTSGVVLPAFLPVIPGLIVKLGGGDPMAIASSIIVGANLVDVSPLSTLGALCVAHASPSQDRTKLFNQLLAWGLSMAVVGAVVCFVLFGLLW